MNENNEEACWYNEGLRFECTKCGQCCCGEPGYVWVSMKEIKQIANYLNISKKQFLAKYVRKVHDYLSLIEKNNGDCIFFDKGCQIYKYRPLQCKSFPFWKGNLTSKEIWDNVATTCPGMNNGKLFTKEEIENKTSLI